MSLAGAMLSNGSTLGGPFVAGLTISGAVTVDDSTLNTGAENATFSGGSLTVTDGGSVMGGVDLFLPATTDIVSGKVSGFDIITFAGTTTIQLGPSTANPFGGAGATYGGILDFTLQNGFTPTVGEQFSIFNFFDAPTGIFSAVNLPALPGTDAWNTSQLYTTGIISVMPEPASGMMLALAGLGILGRRRRSALRPLRA